MLSKISIKYINSLRVKKFRTEAGYFVAEGERLVNEILDSSLQIKSLYFTTDWVKKEAGEAENVLVSADEMKKISGLTTPSNVLAIIAIPDYQLSTQEISKSLVIALDGIQDPGNLGTIIRLADWFGIDTVLCSNDTVDAYSPKVIQSCMGAISRIKIIYCNLSETLNDLKKLNKVPIYGTFMEGKSIYTEKLSSNGVIVMGNEGNGISADIEKIITHKIHIPSFANNRETVESLNVAMATAIVCSEFRRRGEFRVERVES